MQHGGLAVSAVVLLAIPLHVMRVIPPDSRLPIIGETAAVWLFGLTQIIGYGTTYYSFAILAEGMAADLRTTRAILFGVFSLALVLSGLLSPLAGRLMDRLGASRLMGPGSVVAGVFLVAAAMSPSLLSFAIALTVVQVAGAVILYEAAFVALVQAAGRNGQRRIIQLTLIAGFASTVFWPLTQWLDAAWGWRNVCLLYGALNIVVCAPIHHLIARSSTHHHGQTSNARTAPQLHEPLPAAWQNRAFWLVTVGFMFSSIALSAVLAQLVPMLETLGLGAAALAVASVFGPAQVAIRFLNLVIAMDRHPIAITLVLSGLLVIAVLVLMATAPSVAGGVVFVALLGCFSGLKSIAQGALPLALFGARGYGARLGAISLFRLVPAALAPFGFAWLLDHAGMTAALAALCVASMMAFAAFVEISRMLHRL